MTARHLADGAWAEHLACRHLEKQGMKLVDKNFLTRFGEIDLVMRDAKMLVFVEVRLRRDHRFGHPAETIGEAKRRRIRRAAELYLTTRSRGAVPPCRFDVVTVTGDRRNQHTEWFRDAFS